MSAKEQLAEQISVLAVTAVVAATGASGFAAALVTPAVAIGAISWSIWRQCPGRASERAIRSVLESLGRSREISDEMIARATATLPDVTKDYFKLERVLAVAAQMGAQNFYGELAKATIADLELPSDDRDLEPLLQATLTAAIKACASDPNINEEFKRNLLLNATRDLQLLRDGNQKVQDKSDTILEEIKKLSRCIKELQSRDENAEGLGFAPPKNLTNQHAIAEIEKCIKFILIELGLKIEGNFYPNTFAELNVTLRGLSEFIVENSLSEKELDSVAELANFVFLAFIELVASEESNFTSVCRTGRWEFSTRHWCGAEAIMASIEKRKPEYCSTAVSYDPAGKRNISAPPPAGYSRQELDEHAEVAGRLFVDLQKIQSSTELLRVITDCLDEGLGGVAPAGAPLNEKKDDILDVLEQDFKDKRFYITYRSDDDMTGARVEGWVDQYMGHVIAVKMKVDSEFAKSKEAGRAIRELSSIMGRAWKGK